MSEWTTILALNDNGSFSLRFTYELNTLPTHPEQWVQLKALEIESIEEQGEYVVFGLKNNTDNVNMLVYYMKHTSLMYTHVPTTH